MYSCISSFTPSPALFHAFFHAFFHSVFIIIPKTASITLVISFHAVTSTPLGYAISQHSLHHFISCLISHANKSTLHLIQFTPSPPRLATSRGQVFPSPTWRTAWNGSRLGTQPRGRRCDTRRAWPVRMESNHLRVSFSTLYTWS